MGQRLAPRHGSMQVWPRKRAKSMVTRIRHWNPFSGKNIGVLGFAGYKAGMTHVIVAEQRTTKKSKGQDLFVPVTIIECPPIKTASIRFYKKTPYGMKIFSEILATNLDKELARSICIPKNVKNKVEDIKEFDDLRILVYTQPKLTSVPKKKPDLFELALAGSKEDKLKYAQEKLGKEILVSDVFKAGEQVDTHSVTKGKGFQGPVKRFGVGIRSHKSEKTKRGPGSLGAWCGQGHMMYRVAHAGQMGFHTRTEFNKLIIKIDNNPEQIKIKGGIPRYGFVKTTYVLVKGSVGGAKKRLVKMIKPRKTNKTLPSGEPTIRYVSLESKQ